jgi:hypothetical protein
MLTGVENFQQDRIAIVPPFPITLSPEIALAELSLTNMSPYVRVASTQWKVLALSSSTLSGLANQNLDTHEPRAELAVSPSLSPSKVKKGLLGVTAWAVKLAAARAAANTLARRLKRFLHMEKILCQFGLLGAADGDLAQLEEHVGVVEDAGE